MGIQKDMTAEQQIRATAITVAARLDYEASMSCVFQTADVIADYIETGDWDRIK